MTIQTKNLNTIPPKGNSKREKILSLQKFHSELFEKEKVTNFKFIPRLCYPHKGYKVVSFYPRELYGGQDIYIEFCDRNYIPEDPKRILWKWEYNANYTIDYEQSDPHPVTKDRRFLIPISELINVSQKYITPIKETIEEKLELDLGKAGSDVPYTSMSLRDYAAIQWKKPISYKSWLNELITKTFKI